MYCVHMKNMRRNFIESKNINIDFALHLSIMTLYLFWYRKIQYLDGSEKLNERILDLWFCCRSIIVKCIKFKNSTVKYFFNLMHLTIIDQQQNKRSKIPTTDLSEPSRHCIFRYQNGYNDIIERGRAKSMFIFFRFNEIWIF